MSGGSMSIKKNYLYSIMYQVLLIVVPLITAPYLSRTLGAETLGIYSYTNSVAYYFYLFSMLGISNYGNRTIAQVRDNSKMLNETASELLCIQVLFGFMVLVGYGVYLLFLYKAGGNYFFASAIWLLYILSGVLDVSWFFWGIENFRITIIRNIIVKIITTAGVFILVKEKSDLLVYIFLISGSSLICQIILWHNIIRLVSFTKVNKRNLLKHLKNDFVLFIPVIAVSIYTVMDKLMLGTMCTMRQLGYYDNVQKIMMLPTGILTALGTVMMPRISNLMIKGEGSKVRRFINISMQFTCFFSVGFAAGLAGIGKTFSAVYFGNEFIECGNMMILFAPVIIYVAWANVIRTQYLIPARKDKIYIVSVFLGAFVNVSVNICMIPGFSAVGAIIGTICAEAVVAVIQTIWIVSYIDIRKLICDSAFFLIPGLLMFFTVYSLGEHMGISLVTLVIQILWGTVFYISLAAVMLWKSKSLLMERLRERFNNFIITYR